MKVAVLMGGGTSEHEISLLSGEAVATALEERGHAVMRITLNTFAELSRILENFDFEAALGQGLSQALADDGLVVQHHDP